MLDQKWIAETATDISKKNQIMIKETLKYIALIGIFFIYTSSGIFTRKAAEYSFLSFRYICCLFGAFCVLATYAFFWQQIIKRMSLAKAYMFKGTTVIFGLFFANALFNESISLSNCIGSAFIIAGITLFARS